MTMFCPCFFCILIAERKQVVTQPHGHFLMAFHLLGNNCVNYSLCYRELAVKAG